MHIKDLQKSHHQYIKSKKHQKELIRASILPVVQVRNSYNTGDKSSVWKEFIYLFMNRFY